MNLFRRHFLLFAYLQRPATGGILETFSRYLALPIIRSWNVLERKRCFQEAGSISEFPAVSHRYVTFGISCYYDYDILLS